MYPACSWIHCYILICWFHMQDLHPKSRLVGIPAHWWPTPSASTKSIWNLHQGLAEKRKKLCALQTHSMQPSVQSTNQTFATLQVKEAAISGFQPQTRTTRMESRFVYNVNYLRNNRNSPVLWGSSNYSNDQRRVRITTVAWLHASNAKEILFLDVLLTS